MPSQRLRVARYLNNLSWMCHAKSGWPKWQKYHALGSDTALVGPEFCVYKKLTLPREASFFSPPGGAEGGIRAWPRSRPITVLPMTQITVVMDLMKSHNYRQISTYVAPRSPGSRAKLRFTAPARRRPSYVQPTSAHSLQSLQSRYLMSCGLRSNQSSVSATTSLAQKSFPASILHVHKDISESERTTFKDVSTMSYSHFKISLQRLIQVTLGRRQSFPQTCGTISQPCSKVKLG